MSKAPTGTELKRVESYQWPTGHAGHITANQQAALDRFKKLCEDKGYYRPASPDRHTDATHDDETLLRYLRARKFVPQEAFTQFKETEEWRKKNQLDALYETIDVQEYEQTRRLYPQWTGRRDKRGIPFYVFEVNAINAKSVAAQDKSSDGSKKAPPSSDVPRRMLRLFALYENLCRFVLPLTSAIPDREHAETPVSQSSNLVDISKVGFTKFWSLRTHMGDASTLASAHYPETLDRIFVVGAPSFFPTVWQWAQKWFDPITVSKIFILSDKDMAPTLAKFLDMDNVPKKYGGNLDWKFGDMPFLEPDIVKTLRWKEEMKENGHRKLPMGPIKWEYDENGDLTAVAVGTENGVPRRKAVATLHPEAGVARLALSPGRLESKSAMVPGVSGATTPQTPAAAPNDATAVTEAKAASSLENGVGPTASQAPGAATSKSTTAISPETVTSPEDSAGRTPSAASPDTSRAGTYTVPYRDHENEVASPPPDSRQGTSSTRLTQQQDTHADGILSEGSPETRVDGQGEKSFVMEPNTVGQAPKEHPIVGSEEPQSPTVLEQAQAAVGQAQTLAVNGVTAVMGAVGLGAKHDDSPAPTGPKVDPEIDGMEHGQVEEFLRSKTMSTSSAPTTS